MREKLREAVPARHWQHHHEQESCKRSVSMLSPDSDAPADLFRKDRGQNWARGPYVTDKAFAYRYPLRLTVPRRSPLSGGCAEEDTGSIFGADAVECKARPTKEHDIDGIPHSLSLAVEPLSRTLSI